MNRLDKLRERIPSFECEPGCSFCCCSGVIISEEEMSRVWPREIRPPDWEEEGLALYDSCMFLTAEGRCGIHEEKPILCRTFGCSHDGSIYDCPKGRHPEQSLTRKEIESIIAEYREINRGGKVYIGAGHHNGEPLIRIEGV